MSPLRGVVWGLERVQDWLAAALLKRLAQASPQEIETPPSYIAGQLLLQLQFCADEEQLREMYANLLASAMLKGTASSVHPAFVQVIQQLTPDEALLLRSVAARGRNFGFNEAVSDLGRFENKEGSISKQFAEFCMAAGLARPELSDAYLDNLLRLKLLTEQQWSEGEYRPPESNRYGYFDATIKNVSGRIIEVSAFGEHFIRTCVDSHPP